MVSLSGVTPDATTLTKGKIQLAGDLAGTAASPTVLTHSVKRQNDTTNTTTAGARTETGWGAMQFSTTANQISEAVTFNTAFVGRPIVLISPGGDTGNVPIVYGDGDANVAAHQTAKAVAIRNTGFNAYVTNPTGNYTSGQIVYYQWIAIGV